MSTPLFVVGKHRSGTTWLSNLLLDHTLIAGVQHKDHHGIHESAFFSHVRGRYGDLNLFSNFAEFAAVVSKSDYFRLMGVSFEELIELYPSTYSEVFRTVMNRFADRHEARYWLEKSPMHTSRIQEIGELYSDARFVGILRNPVDAAFSWLKRRSPEGGALRRALGLGRFTLNKYVADAHMRMMQDVWPERVCIIRYEDLVERREEVLETVCRFLGLPVEEMHSGYAPNTSYSEGKNATRFPKHEKKFVRVLYHYGLPIVPANGLRTVKHLLEERGAPLPSWFFKLTTQLGQEVD
jgi:hypothetical protein